MIITSQICPLMSDTTARVTCCEAACAWWRDGCAVARSAAALIGIEGALDGIEIAQNEERLRQLERR